MAPQQSLMYQHRIFCTLRKHLCQVLRREPTDQEILDLYQFRRQQALRSVGLSSSVGSGGWTLAFVAELRHMRVKRGKFV